MELTVDIQHGVAVIGLSGDLVASTADDLRERISAESCPYVLLDLSHVGFVDSSGLRAFMATHKRLAESDGMLVCARPNSAVEKIFRMTGADRKLTIVATRQEGLKVLLARMRASHGDEGHR